MDRLSVHQGKGHIEMLKKFQSSDFIESQLLLLSGGFDSLKSHEHWYAKQDFTFHAPSFIQCAQRGHDSEENKKKVISLSCSNLTPIKRDAPQFIHGKEFFRGGFDVFLKLGLKLTAFYDWGDVYSQLLSNGLGNFMELNGLNADWAVRELNEKSHNGTAHHVDEKKNTLHTVLSPGMHLYEPNHVYIMLYPEMGADFVHIIIDVKEKKKAIASIYSSTLGMRELKIIPLVVYEKLVTSYVAEDELRSIGRDANIGIYRIGHFDTNPPLSELDI